MCLPKTFKKRVSDIEVMGKPWQSEQEHLLTLRQAKDSLQRAALIHWVPDSLRLSEGQQLA